MTQTYTDIEEISANIRTAGAESNSRVLFNLTPLGRRETWEDSPEGYPPWSWWRLPDEYEDIEPRS